MSTLFPTLIAAIGLVSTPAFAKKRPLLLWQVEKDGRSSHMLGTCHVAIPLEQALPKPHIKQLQNARVVVTELSNDDLDPMRMMSKLTADSLVLLDHLSEEDFRKVVVPTREALPASMLARMEPWAAYLVLAGAKDGKKAAQDAGSRGAGSAPAVIPMDLQVAAVASANQVPPLSLETADEQLALFADSNELYTKLLVPGSDESNVAAEQRVAVIEGCASGSTDALMAIFDDPESKGFVDGMLYARNDNWMPKLLPELDNGDAFVAVGAAHMLGERGLIKQLEGAGYTVTQLEGKATADTSKLPLDLSGASKPPEIPPAGDSDAVYQVWDQEGGLFDILCAEGQLVRTCFLPEVDACRTRMQEDGNACAMQWSDVFGNPDVPVAEAVATQITSCLITGVMLESIGDDTVQPGPMCDQMKAAMASEMQKAGY